MIITITNVSKSFGATKVFSDLSFSIRENTFVSIVGPSGCGKSTLLNLITRLESPSTGRISVLSSENTRLGYVMQDSLLLPWRTLIENATLGTEILDATDTPARTSAASYFEAFDLGDSAALYPAQSSGGMRQRVALIRTLLTTPSILLLDEPFSNLDFDIKLKVQRYLLNYHIRAKTTVLLVTHDIEDAIALSDRVIVFSEKPSVIKADITVTLDTLKRDPVEARKSPKFREYFIQIWDELKYLDNND